MSEALLQSISNTMVLVLVAGYGWWLAHHGTISDAGRATIAKLVNALIPVFLFYSVTSKFGREQMIELLEMAFLPFITIGLNWAISEAMIRVGLVRKELGGVFVASFSGATVLFVGVPMTTALFGEAGIPYLLVYFLPTAFHLVGRPLSHSNGRGGAQRRRASDVLYAQKRQDHLCAARRCVPARHRFRAHLHTDPELSHGNL